jgi:hypothetical protein
MADRFWLIGKGSCRLEIIHSLPQTLHRRISGRRSRPRVIRYRLMGIRLSEGSDCLESLTTALRAWRGYVSGHRPGQVFDVATWAA